VSDPTDINDNDPTDDENLSSLYGRAGTEQPSKSVDDAVLAKAQDELEQSSKQLNYFPGWAQSFSVAAVIVLSVTVVLMIEKESPVLSGASKPVAVMEQEKIILEKTVPKRILTTKPDHLEEKRQAETQSKAERQEDKADAPAATSAGKLSVMSNMAPLSKAKARKKQEATFQEADSEMSGLARSAQTPKVMAIVADQAEELAGDEKSCQQLVEKECLTSAACTLKKENNTTSYQCLPAKDHCELMFRQSEGTKESCEAKQGCEFIPAQCYCPPDVYCECGGGEPPLCKSENQNK
jgi:hypothetical protein